MDIALVVACHSHRIASGNRAMLSKPHLFDIALVMACHCHRIASGDRAAAPAAMEYSATSSTAAGAAAAIAATAVAATASVQPTVVLVGGNVAIALVGGNVAAVVLVRGNVAAAAVISPVILLVGLECTLRCKAWLLLKVTKVADPALRICVSVCVTQPYGDV